MRSGLCWDFAQCRTEVSGKPIVTVFKGPSSLLPLKMRPVGCLENSVWKYRFCMKRPFYAAKNPPPPQKKKQRTSRLQHVFNANVQAISFLRGSHRGQRLLLQAAMSGLWVQRGGGGWNWTFGSNLEVTRTSEVCQYFRSLRTMLNK